nr:fimbrial protein [Citrobacter sp. FP75]
MPDYTVDLWVTIKVWKTPEYTYQTNAINFTGPVFNEVVQATGSDTISKCPSDRLDERTCVYVSRTLVGNTQFTSGTCQLTNSAQIVHMGKIPSSEVGITPWVDASFSLNCPTAYGYGGAVHNAYNENDTEDGSVSSNNTKNNTVKIQIIPYSEVVDPEHGIMSLNSGGAEGVGIQLAWGPTSEQSNTPPNPVNFGTAVNISALNSNFRDGPYEYGSNASSSQNNLINMAARYVKTTGKVVPGQVNAAIEVMASYE